MGYSDSFLDSRLSLKTENRDKQHIRYVKFLAILFNLKQNYHYDTVYYRCRIGFGKGFEKGK